MFTLKTKDLTEEVTLKNLPTLRQTFLVAASFIIIGYILGYFVSSWFMILPLVVAGGLLISGIFGVCPMVMILQKMPWNK